MTASIQLSPESRSEQAEARARFKEKGSLDVAREMKKERERKARKSGRKRLLDKV